MKKYSEPVLEFLTKHFAQLGNTGLFDLLELFYQDNKKAEEKTINTFCDTN